MKPLLPLIALFAAGCGGGTTGTALPGVSLLENFSMAETSPAGTRWSLDANKGRMDEKNSLMTFTTPRLKFYEAGKVTSTIASRTGSLKMQERSAVLNEEVEVDSMRDGMRLTTTKLYYGSARGKIWTEEPLTIYKGKTVIQGRGFTANPDLSEIEIHHQETRLAKE
ncbi:MAG: LPS export ABC transporter periplasmic protein LptC [Elusimicrobia bacterium]|nr:LPS export ABC transporter periplasmic protein LptC [Elusimicrobiota bacterium]